MDIIKLSIEGFDKKFETNGCTKGRVTLKTATVCVKEKLRRIN